jgi:uncharacterized membrane protein
VSRISQDRALLIGFSTVAFGVVTLLRKVALNYVSPVQFEAVSGVVHGISVPLFLCMIWTNVVPDDPAGWNKTGIAWSAASICLSIVASVAFMYALQQRNDAGIVGGLVSASPVVTLMLSALFLGEQPTLRSVVGVGMVLVGVCIASGK